MANRGGMVPAQGAQQPAAQQQQGPKAWVIWMLFGLGWASLLFFGLSVIPAFPAGVQWSLWAFGWAFVLCWWAGTFMGAGFREDRKVKPAWTSCVIMAAIGTAIGAVPSLAAALYRNWYAVQSIFVAALVYLALTAYGNTVQGAGEPATAGQGQGEAAGGVVADAVAAGAATADGAAGAGDAKEQ